MEDNEIYQSTFLEDEKQNETEEDIGDIDSNLISQAVISGTDWTTETILNQINKGNILLNPRFQRRDAWTKQRKSKFIESLILGLPVPQLVLAQSKDRRGTYIVLDGKQRLLSIRQFAALSKDSIYEKLKLTGLDVRKDLNGKSLEDLSSDMLFFDDLSSFENQPIRTIIIVNWPNETFLYRVFLRLNTGSVSLSPQELRQALHPGPFVDYVEEMSRNSHALREILGNTKPDFRMRDTELLVRYFAFTFFLKDYTGNLKQFLDDACNNLNINWDNNEQTIRSCYYEFEAAHSTIVNIFGKDAYRKWNRSYFETRFNRAVFDILMFVFKNPSLRNELTIQKGMVIKAFKELCENDREFIASIEQTTKSVSATYTRLSHWSNKLNELLNLHIQVPHIIQSDE